MTTIYDLSFKTAAGKTVELKDFSGQPLLIINTATKCGLAPQFGDLEKLHQKYKDQGLVVLGFPCNQFAGQEPETNDSMANVCLINFGVTFTLSEKIDVNGENTHPIFEYLKSHSKSMLGKDIKWNFTKFIVARDGKTVKRFAPTTKPESMRKYIESTLAA